MNRARRDRLAAVGGVSTGTLTVAGGGGADAFAATAVGAAALAVNGVGTGACGPRRSFSSEAV